MNRIDSVDTIRLLAIIAVIAIHTRPFSHSGNNGEIYYYLDIIINQLARFSVPFFFVISGYFWGVKIRGGSNLILTTKNMGIRIGTIFLAWSIIYLLPYNVSSILEYGALGPVKVAYWHLMALLSHPLSLILQGTTVHLWFLVSLLLSLFTCGFFVQKKAFKTLILLSIFLYVFGVLAKAYVDSPFGIKVNFNTRNGPLFGTLLFVIGYFISAKNPKKSWFYYGLILFSIGSLIHFSEIYILMKLYGTSLFQDYVFGTLLMGVGMAITSLSNHSILRNKIFSKVGSMTLGIYAVHFIFVDLLRPVDNLLHSAIWEVGYVAIVFILSVLSVHVLSCFKLTNKVVL